MNNVKDFLSIANVAFEKCLDVKEYIDYPLAFKGVAQVFYVKDYRDNYVICFDKDDDFSSSLQLYVYFKKKNLNAYIYISKTTHNDNKDVINFIFKNHISYIDYCGGVYTYSLNDKIDLLKYLFDASKEKADFSYTKNVQLVLKYYFLKPVRSYTSREVAACLKIYPSSVSRANELLNRLGVLDKSGYGAGTEYKLLNKKSVLKIMEQYFIKPYDNTYFLAVDEQGYKHISSYPVAGQDALSQYTDLMPEKRIPTFAISKKEFKSFYDSYMGVTINNPPHYVQVQSYIYEPNLFTSGDKIDLFDLYITMLFDEDLNDPRVLAAFNNIKERLLNGK